MFRPHRILICAAIALLATPAAAADDDDAPYWATISTDVVNMRVGPAITYQIAWVYKRRGLPLRVLRKKEGWRFVEDPDGAKGWVLGQFLSRARGAIVIGQGNIDMRESGGEGARLLWRVQPGVTGKLGDCGSGWCELDVAGRKGFVRQDRLWGPGTP